MESRLLPLMSIAALDFETCSRVPGAICSVGISVYRGGVEAECFSSLVRPHRDIFRLKWEFQWIHKISRSSVEDKPELPDLLGHMRELLETVKLVVCHNAPFDITQLRAALALYGESLPPFPYLCTCHAGRKVCKGLPNYKLNTMAEHYGFPFTHHDALDDARAAGYIMCRMLGNSTLEEWLGTYGISTKTFVL